MRISDWSPDVCSSDLVAEPICGPAGAAGATVGSGLLAPLTPSLSCCISRPCASVALRKPSVGRRMDCAFTGFTRYGVTTITNSLSFRWNWRDLKMLPRMGIFHRPGPLLNVLEVLLLSRHAILTLCPDPSPTVVTAARLLR